MSADEFKVVVSICSVAGIGFTCAASSCWSPITRSAYVDGRAGRNAPFASGCKVVSVDFA